MAEATGDGWHLDKKVPISIILALFSQFGMGVWYAGRIENRIDHLERDKQMQIEKDNRQDNNLSAASTLMQARLDRIDGKLDRLIERSVQVPSK